MINDKFLKITNAVYKVLEYFPESDPLKNRAKDKALAIMDNLISVNDTAGWASFQKEKNIVNLLEDIDILLGYLWIGKMQEWLNSVNYFIIAAEYEKIKKEIKPDKLEISIFSENQKTFEEIDKPLIPPTEHLLETQKPDNPVLNNTGDHKEVSNSVSGSSAQTGRQKKILDFLIRNEKAQVMDLQTVLPNITKRTIRRDLDELLESGKIIRIGDFNQVSYRIKDSQVLVN